MSTTLSNGAGLDRKALKRPDDFTAALTQFFTALSKRPKVLLGIALAVVGASGVAVAVMNQQESKASAGRDALFEAHRTLENQLKALAEAEKPAPAKDAKAAKDAKEAKDAKALPADPESIAFKKLDVDAQLGDSVKQLTAVSERYSGTRPGFEASLDLGDLYLRHGDPGKALGWYEKATRSAPDRLGKALAWSSLGYAQESSGKLNEALQSFEKALSSGEKSVQGDVLLAIARSHEGLNDSAKARSTYDKIVAQLPNTDYARQAESYRSELK
jgi:tetratricopeptide (TPR) repeat protein